MRGGFQRAAVVGAAVVGAAVPGLLVLFGGLRAPPNWEYEFAIGSWTLAAVVVLGLLVCRDKLYQTARWKVLLGAGLSVVVFLPTLIYYGYLQNLCLIKPAEEKYKGYKNGAALYFPRRLDGNIAYLVDKAGDSRTKAISDHGPSNIDDELDRMPGSNSARNQTTALMLATFLVSSASIALALGLLGFHLVPPDNQLARPLQPPAPAPLPPPSWVTLTGRQATQLQTVIVSAFTDAAELEQLMSNYLEVNLGAVIQLTGSLSEVVFRLVGWADRDGKATVVKFLDAVASAKPGRQDIQALVAAIRPSVEPPADPA